MLNLTRMPKKEACVSASEITMEFEQVSQKKPFIVLRLSHEDFVISCGANKVKIAVHDKDENKT